MLLIADPISPRGHKFFDTLYISELKRTTENILFLASDEITRNIMDDIQKINLPSKMFKYRSSIDYRIKMWQKLNIISKFKNKYNCKNTLFLSYENISTAIIAHRFERLFVVNHNNIDEILTSKVKHLFFTSLPINVEHIVFHQYIKNYLNNEVKIKNKINVIHHPALLFDDKPYEKPSPIVVFAPSSSSDFTLDKIKYFFNILLKMKKLVTIVTKNRFRNFLPNSLNIISKDYFTIEEYKKWMVTADVVFVPLNFKYRISGVIIDALANNNLVFTTKCPFTEGYKRDYPFMIHFVETINSNKDILEIIKYSSNNCFLKDRKKFIKDHSILNISKKIKEII